MKYLGLTEKAYNDLQSFMKHNYKPTDSLGWDLQHIFYTTFKNELEKAIDELSIYPDCSYDYELHSYQTISGCNEVYHISFHDFNKEIQDKILLNYAVQELEEHKPKVHLLIQELRK